MLNVVMLDVVMLKIVALLIRGVVAFTSSTVKADGDSYLPTLS
jgi:hypothetical protein